MINRILMAIGRLTAMPHDTPCASLRLQKQNFRNSTWAEREEFQDAENAARLDSFNDRVALLKIPAVPDWMGPFNKRRQQSHLREMHIADIMMVMPTKEIAQRAKLSALRGGRDS